MEDVSHPVSSNKYQVRGDWMRFLGAMGNLFDFGAMFRRDNTLLCSGTKLSQTAGGCLQGHMRANTPNCSSPAHCMATIASSMCEWASEKRLMDCIPR